MNDELSLKEYEPDGTTIGSIRFVVQNYMTDYFLVNDCSFFYQKD
jgi:hypothetical protein